MREPSAPVAAAFTPRPGDRVRVIAEPLALGRPAGLPRTGRVTRLAVARGWVYVDLAATGRRPACRAVLYATGQLAPLTGDQDG